MKPEFILLTIVGGFLCALIIFLVIFYKPAITKTFIPINQNTQQETVATDKDEISSLKSQLKSLEERLITVTPAATKTEEKSTIELSNKKILTTASVQGSSFTTTSAEYTPMGMFVNINCSRNCLLWVDFSGSSKNLGPIVGAQGNLNSYNLYLDGVDKSIFSRVSLAAAEMSASVSLNGLLPVASGTHTVEIKVKTTGGTLQSDSSFLQVVAIEK